MITINTTRFVNVRFISNVITNLVDVMGASVTRGGSKPASKPGSWCPEHSDSYPDSESLHQEPTRDCRSGSSQQMLAALRLWRLDLQAVTRLAAGASPGQTELRFSAV